MRTRIVSLCSLGAVLAACSGSMEGVDVVSPRTDVVSDRPSTMMDVPSDSPSVIPDVPAPCAPVNQCGAACCTADQRCENNTCVLSCGMRTRCSTPMGDRCCGDGEVCYLEACVMPGATCSDLNRCPAGQYCEPSIMKCLPRAMGEACEYRPMPGMFNPQIKWAWTGDPMILPQHNQVEIPAMVANITDDNGDGAIDQNDIPDVIFTAHTGASEWAGAVLRALNGNDGSRIFPVRDMGYRLSPGAPIAVADVEPMSPGPEIMACTDSNSANNTAGQLAILSNTGGMLRMINVPCGYGTAIAVADMDSDGTAEIAVRNLLVHADGTVLPGFVMAPRNTRGFEEANDEQPTLADMDGDGRLEMVLGNRVIRVDGTTMWERMDMPKGYPAVADLQGDGEPDIVVVQPSTHSVRAFDGRTGANIWGPIETNRFPATMGANGGGPPTIADFDGDGDADVALAGGYNYLVLEGRRGDVLWFAQTQDTSSRITGSSVFDFEGDGRAEVVYSDENQFRVYRGNDGMVLTSNCNTSVTLWEYPVIADVDADDHADIVVISNNYYRGAPRYYQCMDGSMGPAGIRVYSDPFNNWVRTRRIWNQHSYHVTNINEDGTVPRNESRNWTVRGLNNFRQNVQPEGLFDAPDLVPIDLSVDTRLCATEVSLSVRVVNRGRSSSPSGVPVTFRVGNPMGMNRIVGRAVTTRRLLPGESEVLRVRYVLPMDMQLLSMQYYAIINDPMAMPLGTLRECRTENNTAMPKMFQCLSPG